MGRKCAVEGCLSESNRSEDTGVTFHKVPMHSDIRPKWLTLCKIPSDKKTSKVIYVCSRHFLRVDFCNFKGKKYVLRQGVLPSVFPWDKSKLEAIKGVKTESQTKSSNEDSPPPQLSPNEEIEPVQPQIESKPPKIKKEKNKAKVETTVKPSEASSSSSLSSSSSNGILNFTINTQIEVLDNNNTWHLARIIELDYEENEILIHFEKLSSNDEWIAKDSPRLRPLHTGTNKKNTIEQYVVGERCLATWSDARKFPATVTKVLLNDTYEVLFDDGFVKNLRAHRMCKSSPLFDPIQSSKQERREKKRKINIAELFGKRPRLELDEKVKGLSTSSVENENNSPEDSLELWLPQWEDGKPVGVESTIETAEGVRKSVIVADPRLPEGWAKHLTQKGNQSGKWEVFIVSPDNKNFKSKAEIKSYLEDTKTLKFSPSMFDFSLHKQQKIKKKEVELEQSVKLSEQDAENSTESTIEEENKNYLKILLVDNSYQCPIEGCGKTYRRENLAQMHVKHYHPEYTKFLDSTPNVADLAYARTVGESLDLKTGVKNITPNKPINKTPSSTSRSSQKSTPQPPPTSLNPPVLEQQTDNKKCESPTPPAPNTKSSSKDSEIIKLLNTNKSLDSTKKEEVRPITSGMAANMYPDIKLKDLLLKSEGVPSREEINARNLARSSTGIKTLLPVRHENRQIGVGSGSNDVETPKTKTNFKRKRGYLDTTTVYSESVKGNSNESSDVYTSPPTEGPPPTLPYTQINNNIIIEGGKVIKIVRMKQEEIINCTCGYTEEDGLMIQCDLCLCWQHAFCNNIERESQVPEKYVCFICQNPAKQRTSLKYFHDQDWLKHGVLATASYHTKDEEVLAKRFEKLKKSHDVSGGLLELQDFVNTLKIKLKIAEAKNHPKLYLWSKPWEKDPLPESVKIEEEGVKIKDEREQQEKEGKEPESMLMAMLKETKEEKVDAVIQPTIPEPEAAIDLADCRLNLLEHIKHSQDLIEQRLENLEKKIDEIDEPNFDESEDYSRTRQTIGMLLRDLNKLQEFSQRVMV